MDPQPLYEQQQQQGPQKTHRTRASNASTPHQSSHVNYVWRSLDEVTYPRFPPGEPLPVQQIDSEQVDYLDPQMLLRTRVIDKPRRVYSHCSHYTKHSACDLGATCGFVHAVTIDETTKRRRRVRHRAARANGENPLTSGGDSRSTHSSQFDSDFDSHDGTPAGLNGQNGPDDVDVSAMPSIDHGIQQYEVNHEMVAAARRKYNPLCDEPQPAVVRTASASTSSSRSSRAGWFRNPYSTSDPIVTVQMEATEADAADGQM